MATSLERQKNEFQIDHLQPYFTNPENLAKVGLVNFEIIGLTGMVKNEY